MQRYRHKIAFVVATKDRPSELRNMLKSLESQSYKPDQVIIVDGSMQPVDAVVQEFSELPVAYLRCLPPSAAKQRNIGIEAVNEDITLIGFLDDDIVLEKDSLENMLRFWEKASSELGGTAFNMVNHPPLYASRLKRLKITEKFGLYSKKSGVVLPSGFHTMIGYVPETIFVEWLPSSATVWKKNVFRIYQFDEWFSGYSYLEDLDFSYTIGKKYLLAVVENARYYHYPLESSRLSSYLFGKKEVSNRLYFVTKHKELSLPLCYFELFLRMSLNIGFGIFKREMNYLKRALGNSVSLLQNKSS